MVVHSGLFRIRFGAVWVWVVAIMSDWFRSGSFCVTIFFIIVCWMICGISIMFSWMKIMVSGVFIIVMTCTVGWVWMVCVVGYLFV